MLAAAALVVACTPEEAPPEAEPAAEQPSTEESAEADETGLPLGARASDLPADVDLAPLEDLEVVAALTWVLDALEDPGDLSEAEVEAVVTEAFLTEVSAAELLGLFGQIQGEYRIATADQVEARSFAGEIVSGEQRWQLLVAVTEDDPPRIETLFFGPPLEDPEEFGSWGEVEEALDPLADRVSWLAAETTEGVCEPLAGEAASTPRNIASIGKLYVLGAVAEAVDAGDLAWDDEVEVTDELRSLPSGRLQDEPAGTTVTVAEAAELMITISDNTATDLLIDAVGREAVEDALTALGHGDADDTRPFLTTREVFQLLWQVEDDLREEYADADLDRRRELLEDLQDEDLEVAAETVTSAPPEVDRIGWFASPDELCEALVALRELGTSEGLAPVADALQGNPIVRVGDAWTGSRAKGGSLPTVLGFAWDLDRQDGRSFAFVVLLEDDGEVDIGTAIPRIEGALELLAGS